MKTGDFNFENFKSLGGRGFYSSYGGVSIRREVIMVTKSGGNLAKNKYYAQTFSKKNNLYVFKFKFQEN